MLLLSTDILYEVHQINSIYIISNRGIKSEKILIVASDMEIGGAERALLGLLNSIDTILYAVDLFLLRHRGPFMDLIPPQINLLPENKYYSDLGVH